MLNSIFALLAIVAAGHGAVDKQVSAEPTLWPTVAVNQGVGSGDAEERLPVSCDILLGSCKDPCTATDERCAEQFGWHYASENYCQPEDEYNSECRPKQGTYCIWWYKKNGTTETGFKDCVTCYF